MTAYVVGGGWRARLLRAVGRMLGVESVRVAELARGGSVVAVFRPSDRAAAAELAQVRLQPPGVRRALEQALVLKALGVDGEGIDDLPELTPEQAEAVRRGEDVEL